MKRYSYTILLGISLIIAGCIWIATNIRDYREDSTINSIPENTAQSANTSSSADAVPPNGSTTDAEAITPPSPTELEENTPPPAFTAGTDYFDDALFIGDSRTVGLSEYGDLGNADVFASSGMSVFKLFDTEFTVGSGKKTTLKALLEEKQYGKIYIMLGINELGYPFESIMPKYKSVVEEIQKSEPSALLFLGANMHVTKDKSAENATYSNEKIDQLNQSIAELADGKTVFYMDINEVFDDVDGNLDQKYTVDNSHVLGKYCADWVDWILEQARLPLN